MLKATGRWERITNGTDEKTASLVITIQDRDYDLDLEKLGFYHRALGERKKVVLVDLAQYTQVAGEATHCEWLFHITNEVFEIAEFFRWLESSNGRKRNTPDASLLTPRKCKELISKFLVGPSGDDLSKVVEEIPGGGRSVLYGLEDSSLADFYRSLCHRHGELSHGVDRAEPTAFSPDFLKSRKKRDAMNAMEDLRRSLAWPVLAPQPVLGLDKEIKTEREKKSWILLIDDNPTPVLQLLWEIQKSFLREFEFVFWNPNKDAGMLDAITQYQSFGVGEHLRAKPLTLLKLKNKGDSVSLELFLKDDEKGRKPKNFRQNLSFVIVDQLFEDAGGFLGPAVTRGITRLLYDFPASRDNPETRQPVIIALSRAEDPVRIQEALRSGARDYVLKSRLLALPAVLAKAQRMASDTTKSYHRPFRALYSLPNETIGLLQTVRIPPKDLHRGGTPGSGDKKSDGEKDKAASGDAQAVANGERSEVQRAQNVADLLRTLPKPDLHVHAGSCMSPEFLVVASFVGLLRHDWNKILEPLKAAISVFRTAVDRDKWPLKIIPELCDCGGSDRESCQHVLGQIAGRKRWIQSLARKCRESLGYTLFLKSQHGGEPERTPSARNTIVEEPTMSPERGARGQASISKSGECESPSYATFRSILHEELGIPDFLSPDEAKKRLDAKPDLDLALFAIRYSEGVEGQLKGDDLIRIYLLVLATTYNHGKGVEMSRGKDEINWMEFFAGNFPQSLDAKPGENWKDIRRTFYGHEAADEKDRDKRTPPSFSISDFRKRGWHLPDDGIEFLSLKLPRGADRKDYESVPLSFEDDPIAYELATGLRSTNLVEYLQGCEFSGAEHLRHPFLIHLYAQQTLMDFIRQGVFYAELKASPDGYVDLDRGFEFPHVCRCFIEAFSRAQDIVLNLYHGSQKAEKPEDENLDKLQWVAGILGEDRYGFEAMARLFDRKSHQSRASNQQPTATDSSGGCALCNRLPCKVSLVFVGKRHKTTREMILEAAAAAVMRPAGESSVANAKEFVDKEMRRCRVVGFDLAGREYDHPPKLFADEFSRLSRLHIPLTVHAGENAPANFIEDAILLLGAKRIGHGLSLAEDPALMARVREERVCIELCPVCNHQTSHFAPPDEGSPGRKYPLKTYLDHGIYVSINTDNPIISDTNLVKEYFQASYAYSKKGMTLWDALRIMRMGYVCSFLHLPERKAMLELVEQFLFDFFSDENVVANLRELVDMQQEDDKVTGKGSPSGATV